MALKGICLPGSYHTANGCYQCPALPFPTANWSYVMEQKSCLSTFSFPAPGIQEAYIPVGVSKLELILLKSDRQILESVSPNGGESGQFSCMLSVPMNQTIYVVITSTKSNNDNQGLGSIFRDIATSQSEEPLMKGVIASTDQDEQCQIGPYVASIGIHLILLDLNI
jgi:hypothetical protein